MPKRKQKVVIKNIQVKLMMRGEQLYGKMSRENIKHGPFTL